MTVLLENIVCLSHINSPSEFITLGFVVNLLNWDIMLLAPKDKDRRIKAGQFLVK